MNLPVSPTFIFGYILAIAGAALHIVGVATSNWIVAKMDKNDHIGLFKTCLPICITIEDPGDNLKAVRALLILGLLSGLALIGLATVILAAKLLLKSVPRIITIICIAAGTAAFVLTIIGIIVFIRKIFDQIPADTRLGYSFALPIAGSVLMDVAGILIYRGGNQIYGEQYSPLLGNR